MIKILGVPSVLGCNRSGCDQAPPLLRTTHLIAALETSSQTVTDLGDIDVEGAIIDQKDPSIAKNLDTIISISNQTTNRILDGMNPDDLIITIGGDHSIAMGTIFASTTRVNPEELFLLWIDAHGDSNSPDTSPTGNIHGMPLATVLGDSLFQYFEQNAVLKKNIIILGAKDIDEGEWEYFRQNNITVFTMDDIVEYGIGHIWHEIQKRVGSKKLHVSLDIDGLDNSIAPGTGIVNNGGIDYREIGFLARKLATLDLIALDIVEINPLMDQQNKTVELAVELAADFAGGKWGEYEKYLTND